MWLNLAIVAIMTGRPTLTFRLTACLRLLRSSDSRGDESNGVNLFESMCVRSCREHLAGVLVMWSSLDICRNQWDGKLCESIYVYWLQLWQHNCFICFGVMFWCSTMHMGVWLRTSAEEVKVRKRQERREKEWMQNTRSHSIYCYHFQSYRK